MEDLTATWWVLGAGLVLLLILLVRLAQAARRFGRANAALSATTRRGTADLRALMNLRRPRDE